MLCFGDPRILFPVLRPVLQSPRQKAAAAAAEETAAIVFFLAESPARSYFMSRTHSCRTVMNYKRYL